MTRFIPLAGLLGIGLLITGGGCRNGTGQAKSQGKDTAATAVQVIKPQIQTLTLTTTQPGLIEAFETTPIFAKIEGYVGKTRKVIGKDGKVQLKPIADIGDQVKEGEVLVELLVPEIHEEVKQKDALLVQAQAGEEQAAKALLVAEKVALSTKAKIAEAKAGVSRAESDYEFWKAEHKRISELAADGSVTKKLVDEKLHQLKAAEAAREEAAARVESAKALAEESQAQVAKVKADQAAAAAKVKVAQADLGHTKALLEYAAIPAPFDGVITERKVDTGHFVRPPQGGAKPLFVIASIDVVRVVVEVPEKEAGLISVGAKATIQVNALAGKKIPGKVTRMAWSLDSATRTLRTEIDLPNPDGKLRPGMYTTVQIALKEYPKVLAIPFKAVVQDKSKSYCCCVEAGKVVQVDITLGARVGDEVEVVSGLTENHVVIRENAATLKQGQPVEVVNSKS